MMIKAEGLNGDQHAPSTMPLGVRRPRALCLPATAESRRAHLATKHALFIASSNGAGDGKAED